MLIAELGNQVESIIHLPETLLHKAGETVLDAAGVVVRQLTSPVIEPQDKIGYPYPTMDAVHEPDIDQPEDQPERVSSYLKEGIGN